jgi:tetratricopeptide (TPR) repeat protein
VREGQFIEWYGADKDNAKSKYNDAIQFLKRAEELGPSGVQVVPPKIALAYYLAACYSRIEMFDNAIEQLRKIQSWGGLKSAEDVTSFDQNPDFEKLRKFRRDKLKELNLLM